MPVANNLIGKTLNKRYEILRPLGKGGMGKVYLAKDMRFGKQVVVKVPTMEVGDKEFKARFMREIASLANLEHPHIVSTLDWGEIEEIPFLVLRYLGGGSLRDRITDSQGLKKPMPLESLNQWLPQIASALDFIHSKKWVHRDLKPDNILFDEVGNPYLADFGIAKALEGASMGVKTTLGTPVGTPEYMAPEMHLCKGIGAKADQFGLAVLVYESLAGILPFKGLMLTDLFLDVMRGKPKLIHELVSEIPLEKSNALMKGLANDQDKRHDNCGLFANEVTGIKPGIGQLFKGNGEVSISGQIEPLQMKPPIKTGFSAIPDETPKSMPELAVTKVTRNGVLPLASEMPVKVEEAVILPELASTRVIREGVKPLSSQTPLKVEDDPSIPELASTKVIRKGVAPLSSQMPLKVEDDETSIQNKKKNKVNLRVILWAGGILMLVTALVTLVVRISWDKAVADKAVADKAADKAAEAKKIKDEKAAADKAAADKAAADKAAAGKAAADKAAADKAAKAKKIEDDKKAAEANLLKVPFSPKEAKTAQEKLAKSLGKPLEAKINLGPCVLDMVLIPAGKFVMGSPESKKQHEVSLTKHYYMGKYEVTQEQWQRVMGNNPSSFKGPRLPVTNVSWEDCQEFIKKLNSKPNGGYRLPTEAEWEYACRAGTTTAYSFGNQITPKDANYDDSKIAKPVEIESYRPNAFGLYNMHGNVWEWCNDRYDSLQNGAVTDPNGPSIGETHVMRGGSFHESNARSSSRTYGLAPFRYDNDGFRLARTP